ncbi:MAG: hypothetical protein NWF00_10060 [Candidatus Bathyarchaeota archaeon]|nr:hypothetical protein [Candidatus Bathyarchaeota archaeon]
MRKMISVVIIAIFAASTFVAIARVQANNYTAWVGSPGPDTFSYCLHDGTYGEPDDTWVVLGMQGNYNASNPYHYYWVCWDWETGVGGSYDHDYWWYPGYAPQFTFAYDQYGYWSGATGDAPGSPSQNGDRWYWSCYDAGMYVSPNAQKMSGSTYAVFYDPDNPAIMWDIISIPDPIDELTAQAGPPRLIQHD